MLSCLNLFSPLQPECRSGQSVLIICPLDTLQCPLPPPWPKIQAGNSLLSAQGSNILLLASSLPCPPPVAPFSSPRRLVFFLTSCCSFSLKHSTSAFFLANSYSFFRSQFSSHSLHQSLPDLQDCEFQRFSFLYLFH